MFTSRNRVRSSALPAGASSSKPSARSLPEDFQTAEYLREHGMIDLVVPRKDLKEMIARLVGLLLKRPVEPILLDYRPEPVTPVAEPMAQAS